MDNIIWLENEIAYRADIIEVNKIAFSKKDITADEFNRSIAILRSLLTCYNHFYYDMYEDIKELCEVFDIGYPFYIKEDGTHETE